MRTGNVIQIFLAGASGYIGSIIKSELSNSISLPIFNISRNDFKFLEGENSVDRKVVINAAGTTETSKHRNRESNIEYPIQLFDYVAGRVDLYLHLSTTLLNELPIDESNEYLTSKREAEKLLLLGSTATSTHLGILRIPSIWSSKFTKPKSLFQYLVNSKAPVDSRGLISPRKLCHIGTEMTFCQNLLNLIWADQSFFEPGTKSYLRTTPIELIKRLNANEASSPLEKSLQEILIKQRSV